MKIYTIHAKNSHNLDKVIFIKEGISFEAIFLNLLWFVKYKMWNLCFLCIMLISLEIILYKNGFLSSKMILIEILILPLTLGLFGNDILRKFLQQKQYQMLDIISGNSLDDIKKEFFKKYN